jgi:plastocyanin
MATTAAAGDAAAVKTDKVDIADYKFAPETIEVAAGTKVTWTNSDATVHTATADDSSFDTGDIDKGDSATVTFDKPGSFTYYCRFHPFMKATVEVK